MALRFRRHTLSATVLTAAGAGRVRRRALGRIRRPSVVLLRTRRKKKRLAPLSRSPLKRVLRRRSGSAMRVLVIAVCAVTQNPQLLNLPLLSTAIARLLASCAERTGAGDPRQILLIRMIRMQNPLAPKQPKQPKQTSTSGGPRAFTRSLEAHGDATGTPLVASQHQRSGEDGDLNKRARVS